MESIDARKKAMRLLEIKDRTEEELRKKLFEKDFSKEEVDDALTYVSSFGYINDEKYVENYIYYNSSRKSKRRIRYDLGIKGISNELIDRKFSENEYSEIPLIKELIIKKASKLKKDDMNAAGKIKSYLFGKGFDYSDIEEAMRETDILTK